jgi:diaminohydroxyphosphoribosylaminopyrimidine deaminase/5-amino-6-(5-phosphoribosylamino)uracil reductase
MLRALALAERGRGRTRPNPVVGAVIVRGGRVIAEGWHARLGAAHAEVMALERAGRRARGATMYVTLEPCAHVGRTPPCVDALIAAGIGRCVVALRDPHRIVDGRGLRRLRGAGIAAEVGLCAAEAREQLAGYLSVHVRRRPRVTWKLAATLDGRIADGHGHARWITSAPARRYAHRLRARSDVVVVGAGTVAADDPRLTVRLPGVRRQPLRLVCDAGLRLPLGRRLFRAPLARGTVVACGLAAAPARQRALEARGVRVLRLAAPGGAVSPRALLRRLAAEGCHEVLLEGGARLGTAWLRAGMVDRLALATAPIVLGAEGLGWCGPLGRRRLGRALRGRVVERASLGPDALLVVDLATRGE